ncbi:hypothetical protein ACFY64_35585 [Streptomyces collinus]
MCADAFLLGRGQLGMDTVRLLRQTIHPTPSSEPALFQQSND